jgi:hypothetical protein
MAVDSSCRHTADCGQQKSEGKGAPHCCRELSPPHTDSSLLSRREDVGLDIAAAATGEQRFESCTIMRRDRRAITSILRQVLSPQEKEKRVCKKTGLRKMTKTAQDTSED